MTEDTTYKISEAARLVGVSASTLRLWESQGLVAPKRTKSGQRTYSSGDVASLKRVAWLRATEGLNAAAIRHNSDTASEIAPVLTTTVTIGRRLRTLRRSFKKTLEQVASDVGITVSALSTLERTSHGVSFKTLHDLAHYFDTTTSSLSGEEEPSQVRALVPAQSRKKWPQTAPEVTVELLAEGRRQMDCHRFVLAPGASSEGYYRHEGEEFMYLISGRLEVVLDHAEIYELLPGDSLYFESKRQHAWTNRYDGETILIWINTPPTF